MDQDDQGTDYNDIVNTITNMFGDVMSKEAIFAVVEGCEGDINLSVEAIMNITSDHSNDVTVQNNDSNSANHIDEDPTGAQHIESTTMPSTSQPSISYAAASQSAVSDTCTTMPTQISQPKHIPDRAHFWSDQIRRIITFHNQGTRTLVILRGVPGSGKSHLAKEIIDMTVESSFNNYSKHIFSTDDYFMVRGQYRFDKLRLSEAHSWNQDRTKKAAIQGLSPIIVDNTNTELWEIEPYVRNGVKNGYIIEVVEPTTPWAKKLNQLARKNTHNVPIATIKKMLEKYHEGLTGDILIKQYGLSYPDNMVPPVLRTNPAFIQKQMSENQTKENSDVGVTNILPSNDSNVHHEHTVSSQNLEQSISCQNQPQIENVKKPIDVNGIKENASAAMENSNKCNKDDQKHLPFLNETENLTEEELRKHKLFMETQKRIEEHERVAQEWENGESWNDNSHEIMSQQSKTLDTIPKPPRNNGDITPTENLLESVRKCGDWSDISKFMPSWDIPSTSGTTQSSSIKVEKKCSSTSIEIGDTDSNNIKNLKIISTSPRNINEVLIVSLNKEKIPDKRMLDKSSMTNEQMTAGYRCKNEEKHFIAFRKLFKNVARADLRDVFDKCCGDVNWAVDIIFDSVANKSLETLDDEDLSDVEEDDSELCDCMSAYNIIPDVDSSNATIAAKTVINEKNTTGNIIDTPSPKKTKRDTSLSDTSILLKQHIEQQVVISENHYSPRHLMYRKYRRGDNEDISNQPSTSENVVVAPLPDSNETVPYEDNSDEEHSSDNGEEIENIINVNLGMEFVTQLDHIFGRNDMEYPENIVPRISMPVTLLNEINALWMESIMHQFEQQAKQSEILLKQDEEFARQLAIKEAELIQEGKEPAVPDFKEIMDMDLAVALYHKDVDEWRNSEPKDLAARLSRDKLYNLFPDVAPAVLSELLMAHNNNFQSTVEVLLMSTGRADILESENGINKFVMEKELERQEKFLEEEKKASLDAEWPLLTKGAVVEMSTVEEYRKEAEKHLLRRNMNHQKAHDYIQRGMTQVANHYSEIAAFHKQKYELANSMAAASLIQVHASKNQDDATIDLHFLRVGEAKEALDLFLDTHIQKLRESQGQGGPRYHTLYFITGRGLHSPTGPKIKPAVKARLGQRGLLYSVRNPGLLTAKVWADDKLSHQLTTPP